jgi:hypothetical protein
MKKSYQNQAIQHPLNDELYQYRLGNRFDPGAEAEVFEPLFELPVIVFRGAGRVAGSLMVTQHPQVWFNPQSGIVGLGGVQAGQLISQPLIDPAQYEGD